jgi:hypothetical protein
MNTLLNRNNPRGALLAALLLTTAAGCSGSTGSVSGQVTFQGQPVPAGTIAFVHDEDGKTVSGSIQNGSYSVDKVPTGPCTILVVSAPPPKGMWNPQKNEMVGGSAAANQARYALPLPARYNDPKQSDLHYEVAGGSQTYDIPLKP